MQLMPPVAFSLLLLLVFSTTTTTTTNAHNITRILATHPAFSTFNHYLTITHLAAEINRRETITVCAVDNAAMSDILAKHLNLYTLKNILSLHVFADYFGSKKLHQITGRSTLTATMFQATGKAEGMSGYVNITNLKGGRVGFGAVDNDGSLNAVFVKSIEEKPYNISVIQISQILSSPEAEAPAGAPNLNFTVIMKQKGCKAFSDLLATTEAEETFMQSVDGGLTVFCPSDPVVNAFMPKYKNLTKDGKVALLLYHGVPIYQSMGMLKSNNGLMNTLATEGANKYDFTVQNEDEDVKLETKVVTAKIVATLVDEEPLSVYKIDKFLLPRELFKAAPAAPAKKGDKEEEAEAPGPDGAEDAGVADQEANDNGSLRLACGNLMTVVLGLYLGGLVLL